METPNRKPRRVLVVDDSALAHAVGRRIHGFRLARSLSQKDVAGDRFTPAYISALERGLAKPSLSSMNHIAVKLGIWIGDLLPPPTDEELPE